MTEEELRKGFAEGRTLVQHDYASDIDIVNKLVSEGVCKASNWAWIHDVDGQVRIVDGIKKGE